MKLHVATLPLPSVAVYSMVVVPTVKGPGPLGETVISGVTPELSTAVGTVHVTSTVEDRNGTAPKRVPVGQFKSVGGTVSAAQKGSKQSKWFVNSLECWK